MKAGFRQGPVAYLKEIAARPLAPDQVRLRVQACGICGSDLHLGPGEPTEQAIGHEVAGVLTELGNAVRGLEIGQRVALDSSSACGRCASCRNGRQDLCTGIQSMFHIGSMGLAEEMVAPAPSA